MLTDPSPSASEPRTLVTHPELRSHQSFPFFKTIGEPKKSALERLLSLFADVRAGEGVGVLLLSLNVFLLLAGYSALRPAREGLISTQGGALAAAYSSVFQAVLLIGIVPLFGWLASRVRRIRLIATTSLLLASNLLLFNVLGRAGVRLGVIFYVWLGIYNVFIISQFWAFANDLYTEGQGRRLFPMIGVGASLGAWVGSTSVEPLVNRMHFTPYTIMMLGAVILLIALAVTVIVNSRETVRGDSEAARINATPVGKAGGFQLILQDRYLLWIAVLTILLNVVNSSGEFLLRNLVIEASKSVGTGEAAQQQFVTAFRGSIDSSVNLLGLLLQLFVTSRVMRFLGVRGALFILPVVALINYSVIAVAPLLAVVRITKILENGTDYSIQNTIRQALYLPVSREAKYKAKNAIDTFFTRIGDVVSAGFVRAGPALGMGISGFAWLNVGLTLAWLGVAARIAREHRRKTV
jgi:AAA family ATP:ADP antiporter